VKYVLTRLVHFWKVVTYKERKKGPMIYTYFGYRYFSIKVVHIRTIW